MFEVIAVVVAAGFVGNLIFGIIIDDQFYVTVNTLANLATVALLVWHQRHIKKQIEPEVKDTATIVKRQLGERSPGECDAYNGPERRKNGDNSATT